MQTASLKIREKLAIEQPMSSSLGYRCESELTPILSCVQVHKRPWRVSAPHLSVPLCGIGLLTAHLFFFSIFVIIRVTF